MKHNLLIEKAESYVKQFVHCHNSSSLLYHNIRHIENVVKAAQEISEHYKLSERDHCICMVAAWFHDIGYCDCSAGHEERSAKYAADFLRVQGTDEEFISSVSNCIMATKMPQKPSNLLEQILCDADLY